MNLEMLKSREPEDVEVLKSEFNKLKAHLTELLPIFADRREEIFKEQDRFIKEEGGSYFLTNDWEIDLGVYLDTNKMPSHFSEVEFYARLLLYAQIMKNAITQRLQELEERLLTQADIFYFHVKELAEQGNEEAKIAYEKLKKIRPGGDKP